MEDIKRIGIVILLIGLVLFLVPMSIWLSSRPSTLSHLAFLTSCVGLIMIIGAIWIFYIGNGKKK